MLRLLETLNRMMGTVEQLAINQRNLVLRVQAIEEGLVAAGVGRMKPVQEKPPA